MRADEIKVMMGRLVALIEAFAEYKAENKEDHKIVVEKIDTLYKKIEDMQIDHRANTEFRVAFQSSLKKASVWLLATVLSAFIVALASAAIAYG